LGSYYSVANYKGINPEFGTKADFQALIKKAHQMGFKVILDWVANHTGWDNPWMAHKDWYEQDENGNILYPYDWSDVAELNYDNQAMRNAMIDAMSYWVKQYDVDGFRCDVAGMVPVDFWKQATTALNKLKPLFMLAEDGDNMQLMEQSFRANYGWNLYNVMNNLAKENATSVDFEMAMLRQQNLYPTGAYPMQFITNHDENSWNGTEKERLGNAVPALTAMTFTVPGMPLIYSGQESGSDHRLAFFEKDQINWGNYSVQPLLTKLSALKKANQALWNGNAGGKLTVIETNSDSGIAFVRKKGTNRVVYVVNASASKHTFRLAVGSNAGTYKSFHTGKKVALKSKQKITLKPWAFEIYTK
jgi:glycosidase